MQATTIKELPGVKQSYLDEYFGVWAIHNDSLDKLVIFAQGVDLRAHIDANAGHKVFEPSANEGSPYDIHRGEIAVIDVAGPMMKHSSSMSSNASTVMIRRQLSHAVDNDQITAIVMRFDTPGGTVSGTQDLASAIDRTRQSKPVFGFAEDLCASAGYWAISQTERIYANQRTALVGSIGTFSVLYDMSKMADEKGIKVHVIKAGDFKGSGVPGTEITDQQIQTYQGLINSLNDEFKKGVAKGRNVTLDKVNQWADGRVHTAAAAKELGLIDDILSFDQVLDEISNKLQRVPMSKETATETPVLAASLDQLEAACPGASADFLMSQLKAKATIGQATAAMIKSQNEALAKAETDKAEAVEKATAEATEKAKLENTTGVPPLTAESTGDGDDDYGDAVQQFGAKIAKLTEGGRMTRQQAVVRIARTDETLHKQYLIATNKPSQVSKLRDKFETQTAE